MLSSCNSLVTFPTEEAQMDTFIRRQYNNNQDPCYLRYYLKGFKFNEKEVDKRVNHEMNQIVIKGHHILKTILSEYIGLLSIVYFYSLKCILTTH